MKVLVAAPYPPMPGPEAEATLALVRSLLAAGDEVTVVSPAPSAAHHHCDPGGARGAARLVRLSAGTDRLILRLDARGLAASSDPPRALPGRLGLAAAIRRAPQAEVFLDRVPAMVSRRWAALVLGGAERVTVGTDAERATLEGAGVPASRVVVDPALEAASVGRRRAQVDAGTDEPVPATAGEVEALVRRRAASERLTSEAGHPGPEAPAASLPLRHLVRMEPASVKSSKPVGLLVKRFLARLLAWQFDNVIQHVNRLHQAMIESVEALTNHGDESRRE